MTSLIIIITAGLLLLFVGLGKNKNLLVPLSTTAVLLAMFFQLSGTGQESPLLNGMISFDSAATGFGAMMMGITLLILLLGVEYYADMNRNVAENYALLLFSLTGAILMVSFNNLVVLFLGIEILSIPLYILAGGKKKSYRSNEASFKYFLLGSFASAFLLFGIALLYGVTASFGLEEIRQAMPRFMDSGLLKTGVLMIIIGMAFKVAAVPFHFWSPDVYEGSPTLVTAYMATVVKTAGFAAFWRLLDLALIPLPESLIWILWILTFLTMTVSSFTALWQSSFKRLLAYSSISNSGFLMLVLLSSDPMSPATLWYYTFTYSLATLIAFSVLFSVKKASGGQEQLDIFNGLWKNNRFIAFVLAIALLSLAGIPPLAGFFAKYMVFFQAIRQDFLWITLIAILMALVGIYYYFSVFRFVFSSKGEPRTIPYPLVTRIVVLTAVLLLFILGVYPTLLTGLFP